MKMFLNRAHPVPWEWRDEPSLWPRGLWVGRNALAIERGRKPVSCLTASVEIDHRQIFWWPREWFYLQLSSGVQLKSKRCIVRGWDFCSVSYRIEQGRDEKTKEKAKK